MSVEVQNNAPNENATENPTPSLVGNQYVGTHASSKHSRRDSSLKLLCRTTSCAHTSFASQNLLGGSRHPVAINFIGLVTALGEIMPLKIQHAAQDPTQLTQILCNGAGVQHKKALHKQKYIYTNLADSMSGP